MNKFKWALMIAAILLGIGGAILTRPDTGTPKNAEPFYAAESCVSGTSVSATPLHIR